MNAENQSQLHRLSAGGRQPRVTPELLQERTLRQIGRVILEARQEKVQNKNILFHQAIASCDSHYAGVTVIAAPRDTVRVGVTVVTAPKGSVHAGVTIVIAPKVQSMPGSWS